MSRFTPSLTTAAAAARAALDALFGPRTHTPPAPAQRRRPPTHGLASFQQEAVNQAEQILARFGGTLIADPVGMGKTRIGATLATTTASAGLRTLVLAPATLRRQWTAALRSARSTATSTTPSTVNLVIASHTDLSRDAEPDDDPPFHRIVIDEAHAFRNPNTRRYRALAKLARSAQIAMLTATPINNSLLDLYFLIRLFAGDGHFAELGVPNLERLFRDAALAPDTPPPPPLASVLRAITIRRTRAETGTAHLPPDTRFPERAAPATIRFRSPPSHEKWTAHATRTIESLRLPPYDLGSYGAAPSASAAATLLRLTLAKRLESGNAAFMRSANDLRLRLKEFGEALEKGLLRTPASHTSDSADGQLLLDELLLQPLPRHTDRDRLATDTAADIRELTELMQMASGLDDPKAAALEHLLFHTLAHERALVFTEFRDTATDLWQRFRQHGGVAMVRGTAAFLGSGQASRADIIRRFAPRANDAPAPPPHEAVRILIATDVLSEGLNLQDAAHVVSYDLPWNPVRLLQRIGRIDRLGSPHHTVFSHHFLPEAGVERLLRLTDRLRHKLAAIRLGLGTPAETTTALATAATPAPAPAPHPDTRSTVERIAEGDASLFDDIERLDAAPFLTEARLRRLHASTPATPGESADTGTTTPRRGRSRQRTLVATIATTEPTANTPAALVAVGLEGRTTLLECFPDGTTHEAGPAAASLLEQALRQTERPNNPADDAAAKAVHYARTALRATTHTATRAAPIPRRHTGPAYRALLLLRRTAATTPGGPTPDLCARIDRLTTVLAHGLRAGHERALQEALDAARWSPPSLPSLCALLESALGPILRPPNSPPTPPPTPHPIAVLLTKRA